MRILKCAVAFVLVFCMLAVTVVCSAVAVDNTYDKLVISDGVDSSDDANIEPYTELDVTDEGATEYAARMHAPKLDNPYYYSDKNIFYKYGYGMPNCTCYAWGRAYEILKKEPQLCIYDAYLWYDYNKNNKIYAYGQTPKLGAIACYKYIGYDAGHVAVVEKIIGDTVYYSNSAYSGQTFYINTTSVDDPSEALSNAQFLGFIYIGEYYSSDTQTQGDVYKITSDDGVNMRSGAGTSYGIVGAIPYGNTVTVIKTQKADGYTWGYTSYKGVAGWFVTDFAKLISSDKPTVPSEPDKPDDPDDPQPQPVMGDVDLDGEMSIMDSTLIQMFIAQLKTLSEDQQAIADIDGDSQVSVMDSTEIRLKLAGLK